MHRGLFARSHHPLPPRSAAQQFSPFDTIGNVDKRLVDHSRADIGERSASFSLSTAHFADEPARRLAGGSCKSCGTSSWVSIAHIPATIER